MSLPGLDLVRFFSEAAELLTVSPRRQEAVDGSVLGQFFDEAAEVLAAAESRQREWDRTHASRFNVFDLIEPDENKLSDVLADLLHPDGRHGQGPLFLSLLLEQLGCGKRHDPGMPVKIVREAPTHGICDFRRRIDIVIHSDILFAIENKIDSPEQCEQVKDYLDYLRIHSRDWSTPAFLIYLTPNGRLPTSVGAAELARHQAGNRLICWSYERDLRTWLGKCQSDCESDKIRHFLMDFIAYIDSALKRKAASEESEARQ